MTDNKAPDAKSLVESDKVLLEQKDKIHALHSKWMQLASEDSLKATVLFRIFAVCMKACTSRL